jgi:hypothetical protein
MYRVAIGLSVGLAILAAACLTPGNGRAQRFRPAVLARPLHPFHAHWGCFGFCNGPLNPVRRPFFGCFGFCNGPLNPVRRPFFGCFGFCHGPFVPNYGCYGYCTGPIFAPTNVPMQVYQPTDLTTVQNNPPALTYTPPPAPTDNPNDPVVQGKKLSEWVNDLKGWDAQTRGTAVDAIGQLGPRAISAVPDLIARCSRTPTPRSAWK